MEEQEGQQQVQNGYGFANPDWNILDTPLRLSTEQYFVDVSVSSTTNQLGIMLSNQNNPFNVTTFIAPILFWTFKLCGCSNQTWSLLRWRDDFQYLQNIIPQNNVFNTWSLELVPHGLCQ